MKNVSDVPVYNPLIVMDPPVAADNFIYQPDQQLSYSAAVIQPGQTFYTSYLVLIPQVSGQLDLGQAFVAQVGGNSTFAATVAVEEEESGEQADDDACQQEDDEEL